MNCQKESRIQTVAELRNYKRLHFVLHHLLANKVLFTVLVNTNQQLVKPGVQF